MQTLRLFLWLIVGVGVLGVASAQAAAGPLDPCLAAHGGVERWQRLAYLGYSLEWTAGPRVLADARKIDLRAGTVLVTGEKFSAGLDATGPWVAPDALAIGDVAPQLYLKLPTRFATLPFGLALDPAAEFTDLGRATVRDRELRVVQVRLAPPAGAGGVPELFVIYFEPKSGQVQLVRFSVAGFSPALDSSALLTPPTEYVAVIDIWQTVAGLTLPRRAKLHVWRDGGVAGEQLAAVDILSPTVGRTMPAGTLFARPAEAVPLR